MIFLGDSITDADHLFDTDGRDLGQGYVREIANSLGPEAVVKNRGHNAYTAWQVDRALEGDCLHELPDEVTLLVGINDVSAYIGGAGGYDAAEYGQIMDRILTRLTEAGAAPITVMEPFLFLEPEYYKLWEKIMSAFQEEAKRAAESHGARWIPLAEIFRKKCEDLPIEEFSTDGVHLTDLGHAIVAREWLTYGRR